MHAELTWLKLPPSQKTIMINITLIFANIFQLILSALMEQNFNTKQLQITVHSMVLILDGYSEMCAYCARKELSLLFDQFKAFD